MAWRAVTNQQWALIEQLYLHASVLEKAVGPHSMTARASQAFCGFCGLVLPGANYRHDTAPSVRSTAV